MKIQKIIIAIVVLSAMFCAVSSKTTIAESRRAGSETAKCRIPTFNEAYDYADAIFVGKVIGEEKNGDVKTFEFEVEKYWKGAKKTKIKINVYETARYQAWFQTGEKYLIYATADDDGKLKVGRCSRSNEAENASEDLEKLGAGKNPA